MRNVGVATQADWMGGSTYSFDIDDDHPHRAEVLGFLGHVREQAMTLRRKVEAYNESRTASAGGVGSDENKNQKVVVYVGQTLLGNDESGDGEDEKAD